MNCKFYIRLLYKYISLLGTSSDSVIKFSIYHLPYKEKLGITESNNKLVINSAAFLIAYNSGICAAQPGLIAKKGKLSRTLLTYTMDT